MNERRNASLKDKGPRTKSGTLEVYPPGIVGDIVDERIVMGHGAGGRKMHRLIRNVFVRNFGNPALRRLADAAVLPELRGKLAMTTDSYVVQPLFFPGGDIGRLAVCGTVNDLAVMGARPLYISLAFVLREGLEVAKLEAICRSAAAACRNAGVQVVTGDTKVIERGETEELYVNTTGIGTRSWGRSG
jgi:hydrogenase expression/formation protein HypE